MISVIGMLCVSDLLSVYFCLSLRGHTYFRNGDLSEIGS